MSTILHCGYHRLVGHHLSWPSRCVAVGLAIGFVIQYFRSCIISSLSWHLFVQKYFASCVVARVIYTIPYINKSLLYIVILLSSVFCTLCNIELYSIVCLRFHIYKGFLLVIQVHLFTLYLYVKYICLLCTCTSSTFVYFVLVPQVHLFTLYLYFKYICLLCTCTSSTFVYFVLVPQVHLFTLYLYFKYICLLCTCTSSTFVYFVLVHQVHLFTLYLYFKWTFSCYLHKYYTVLLDPIFIYKYNNKVVLVPALTNRPFPQSMRSQGKRLGCGSRQACRPRSRFQRMTLRWETLTGHYFKFDFSWVTMTSMDKTEGIFLNLQCNCHRVASIFIKLINQRTYFSTWLPGLTAL